MKSYRVLWAPTAEDQLDELLRHSGAKTDIAAAAREIDRKLLATPMELGESRFDDVRIGFALPLGIQFEVLEDVRTVIVFDVWRVKERRAR